VTLAAAAGLALALGGVAGLVWLALGARRLGRSDLAPEAARREWRRLAALNGAAVALAFLGLALIAAGSLLGG
jgi:hypothetical protein